MLWNKTTGKILGAFLIGFSFFLGLPLIVSAVYSDGNSETFILTFAITFIAGFSFWYPLRKETQELKIRDGFLIVALFWIVLSLTGSIPFVFSKEIEISTPDAIFESFSGLTTTGATVIRGLDTLPPSLLFYRQMLQWLGGMGIIVLAVAILPILGIGGMQLYKAESPGPIKDTKLTPRIKETAKALWYLYVSLTVVCAIAYYMAGMSALDAVGHSFSTIAIGGFSTHDDSMRFFDSAAIDYIAILFMFLAGINFTLHFLAWRRKTVLTYIADSEFKAYVITLVIVFALCAAVLIQTNTYSSIADSIRYGLFQSVSIGTTTGFTNAAFHLWPTFLPALLVLSSFVGGCAGSTGGGIKVIRCMLLFKQGGREIKRLIHPNAIIRIRVGDRIIEDRVVEAVWGFFAAYILIFVILLLSLMGTGLDQATAFSSVAACLNNLGPGLGTVHEHYGNLSTSAKYLLCLAMLMGRLEIFTLLVLFSPAFWRA